MPMHESKKRRTIQSDKKLKSNNKSEFVKREILVPLILGEYDYERREIWDHYRHKETGVILIRVMTFHTPTTDYRGRTRSFWINWLCPELGGGTCNMSYWIQLAKQSPRKHHDN